MRRLTIFTPTYNRCDLLERGYEALKQQDNKDFEWLIIDDGSTDGTKEKVAAWAAEETEFPIRYFYKENGGLHTAYNAAISNLRTELAMCIDSDDWIAEGAVSQILENWEAVKREGCAGIVAQDGDINGKPLCVIEANGYINLNEYDAVHSWMGDRKLIIRSELYKSVAPMPSFPGEKNFNPQYMHIKIAALYDFYVMNKIVCIVDYQETGMSAGIFRQFLNSPNSFAEYRRLKMTTRPNSLKKIVRNAIHYDSSCILAGKYADIVKRSPCKLLTAMVAPAGFALSVYIRMKATK